MTPVAVVDWLALLAALIGLVVLLRGWANISSTTLRHTLAGLVLLVLFNGLSNSLQWSGITTAFDPFEDYTQLLIPLLYGLAVYDILRRRVEQDLQETAEQLRQERDLVQSITQTSPAGIILLNPQGEITYANRRAEEVLGKSLQELLGSECDLLECSEPSLDGDLATQVQVPCRLVAQTRRPLYDLRCSVCRPDGQQVYLAVNAAPLPDLSGALQGVVMTFEDVTQRVLAEGALFNEKERAQVTLHSIGDAVITTDAQARVEYLNPVAEALTGWTSTEARGMPLAQVFQVVKEQTRQPAPDPVARCLQGGKITGFMEHTVLISRGGKEYDIDDTAAPIRGRDGQVQGVVLVFHDVTEARRLERKMAHDAAHDTLTGLVNRREFEVRVERALASAKERGAVHVLCYLDLDQFKIINDTSGHAAGDELLKQVANLLGGLFRHRDTLARLGGDEFGLLLENCPLERGVTIANEVVAQVHQMPFAWESHVYQIGVSIGIVPISAATEGLAQALSQADVACYTAKDLGRGRVHVYQWREIESTQRHGEILRAARLREALDWELFHLYCQPILALSASAQAAKPAPSYELLLRLLDEDGQILHPAAFIPSAERYGLMTNIDRWVIQATFRRYAIHFSGVVGPRIAINISGSSLNDQSLLDFIYARFHEHNVPPERVCFEIAETAAIHNLTQAQRFASEVCKMGGSIALDDFGSAFSSFRYLKNLPVSYLKIEGSFVRDMLESPSDRVMVAAINQVGHTLGIQTIAEHVSDAAIIEELRQMGVDYAQGYAIGQPQPLAEAWGTESKSPWVNPRA
jgi:diguanylate cyclase (GGDEF)-like protein/PAS domain S-box-containing protein